MSEMFPFVTWMDLEVIVSSEISQSEIRHIPYDSYMWNLKTKQQKQQSQAQRTDWWMQRWGMGEMGEGSINLFKNKQKAQLYICH